MIYADFNSSSYPHPKVLEYMRERLNQEVFANPNSIHSLGQKVLKAIEISRKMCAEILDCKPGQIIFNSGASEGISQVFFSVLKNAKKPLTILGSQIEHSAVVENLRLADEAGHNVLYINTLENGQIDLTHFEQLVKENDVDFVTVMAANNETGVIQPIERVSQVCQENNILFFSDTTQYIGKHQFSFKESGMDFAVLSSHKVGSLIGSGALLVKDPQSLNCFIHGGGQENGLRGGTQNYLGIEALGYAMKLFEESIPSLESLKQMKLSFEHNLKSKYDALKIVGEGAPRLAGTSLIGFSGLHGQVIQIELESRDIFVSTSSACSDNEPNTSKVLKAMKVSDQLGRSVTRLSFCCSTKQGEFDHLQKSLIDVYNKLSKVKY
ncbi:cysteine desulfurase [Bacteriovoracaceae bacterium]|nr:cysteine desulfurase [Bacteriovoracaceae bacterium]